VGPSSSPASAAYHLLIEGLGLPYIFDLDAIFVSCRGSVKGHQFYLICVVYEEGRTHYFAESFVLKVRCDSYEFASVQYVVYEEGRTHYFLESFFNVSCHS
jgi:hypothetical protein